ncbi:hypothetical protein VPNG_08065 [Cytospora leucostoma]|uniref:NAD(P)-binding domain-containing protein n=1 Tax=Cytospora leucostoma TaxID=1230097 RepID=A0A423WSQ5_9PEZI|nr:hypothetical protein VPNG_08065 [Cytospora leucostoma]
MSTNQTKVLITGIGRGLAEAFLSRPNHIVVAAVRNLDTTLKAYKPAEGSKLILVKIENTSASDPAEAIQQIRAAGVNSLDIVIANAGINPTDALVHVEDIDIQQLRNLFEVNTISYVTLFQAARPLLKSAAESKGEGTPKLLAISSNASTIIGMEPTLPFKVGPYGASKSALNYLVRRTHFENPWLTAWVVNPGFVQTDNGDATAKAFGIPQAPNTLEESVTSLLSQLDGATRSETSGKFFNFDGTDLPW